MMKLLKILLLSFSCALCINTVQAQDKTAAIKKKITGHLARIQQFAQKDNEDSLLLENKNLMDFLVEAGTKDAGLLTADLTSLQASAFYTLRSEDGKLNIYQWKSGGDHYNAAAAFKTNNGTGTMKLQEAESTMKYDSLLSVNGKENTCYLLISRGSNKMDNTTMELQAYTISDNSLNIAAIFASGASTVGSLSIAYSRNSPSNGKMLWQADKQLLSVSSPGSANKPLIYKFDGDKFIQQKNP